MIIPARYLNMSTPEELAQHCMEDIDPSFVGSVETGDIIVGGANFGCGSSREHAPMAIKGAGVSCVVAESFARIFYRNAINIGLPILVCVDAAQDAQKGDELRSTWRRERSPTTSGKTYRTSPFPPFVMGIIKAGGLIPYTRAKVLGYRDYRSSGSRRRLLRSAFRWRREPD